VATWVLLVAFVVVPLVEVFTIVQVGQVIGAWWTIVLLVADSVLGAWLMKREGRRAWQALTSALGTGRMPARELADAALVLVGGTLMLTPGFVTDVAALFLILPLTRPLARALLSRLVTRRLLVAGVGRAGPWGPDVRRPGPYGPGAGPVVRGDVVDE